MLKRIIHTFFLIGILSISITGCSHFSTSDNIPSSPQLSFEEGTYFLCSHDYENGIELYNSDGKVVFELENARVDECAKYSGATMTPAAGQIPEESYLFITQQNGEETFSGVWDVKSGEWKLPLQSGNGFTNAYDGQIDWYTIYNAENTNNIHYNIQFEILEDITFKSYKAGNRYLHNEEFDNGLSYIADENGTCVLDGVTFYERNKQLRILRAYEQNSIELQYIYDNKYMYVHFKQDDSRVSTPVEYVFVCTLDGHILCSDYAHTAAWNPKDQYTKNDPTIFLLHNFETDTSYYVDTYTGQEWILPEQGNWRYMNESYFIFDSMLDGITIYDAKTQTIGTNFSDSVGDTSALAIETYVLGLNSYVLSPDNNGVIVIDGENIDIPDATEKTLVTDGPYTIVSYGSADNPYDYCYIIDKDGHLVLETDQKVVYADAQYYITINNDNTYSINNFNETVKTEHLITTDNLYRTSEAPTPLLENVTDNNIPDISTADIVDNTTDASISTNPADASGTVQREENHTPADINLPDKPPSSNSELTEFQARDRFYTYAYAGISDSEINDRLINGNSYYRQSTYAQPVSRYWENVRGATDVSNLMEPLYFTDMKYYDAEDFSDAPAEVLRVAKNEIYARHGYIFNNQDLQNYFLGCAWYEPKYTPEQFDTSVFNKYEVYNLKLLTALTE